MALWLGPQTRALAWKQASPFFRKYRYAGTKSLRLPRYKELIVSEKDGGVVLVELNRPERLHALSEQLADELIDFCNWAAAERDPVVRAVVVTGAPAKSGKRAFSTGRDLKLSSEHITPAQKHFYLARALDSVLAMKRLEVPTVAAVAGPAFGWGAELALACDIRLLAPDSTICFPETSLGLFPGAAGAVLLPRLLPPSLAKEMIFTAARYSGEQASALGLGRVVLDPVEEALVIAGRIAANSPLGLRGAKRVMDESADNSAAEALELSRQLRPPLTDTEDFQEGLASFREKRKPVFQGR